MPVASLAHQGTGRLDLAVGDTDAVAIDALDAPGADVTLTNNGGALDLNAIESGTAGTIAVNAEAIVLGDVASTGDQIYGGAARVDGAAALASTAGGIELTQGVEGTTAGQDDLTLIASSDTVTLGGGIASSVPLRDLTAGAANLVLDSVQVSGTFTGAAANGIELRNGVSAATAINFDADADTNGTGAIAASGDPPNVIAPAVVLRAANGVGSAPVPIATQTTALDVQNTVSGDIVVRNTGDLNLTVAQAGGGLVDIATASNLTIGGLDAPNSDVALAATDGSLVFAAGITPGSGGALGTLVASADSITLSSVTTARNQSYAAGLITLNSTYATNGGDFTADGAVLLGGELTEIDTRGPGPDGQISFTSTIDGTSLNANDLTLHSGDGAIAANQAIGVQVPLNILTVDTDFVPTGPLAQNIAGTAGQPISVPISFPASAPPASANRQLRVSGLNELPAGTVLSDGVNLPVTIPPGSDTATFSNVPALTVTLPTGTDDPVSFEVQVADVNPGQVSLPSGQDLQVARFEPDTSAPATFMVTATPPPPPSPSQPPLPFVAIPPSANAGNVSGYTGRGLEFAIPDVQPARLPDITPVTASAAQIQAQIAQLQGQIEPAGPDEGEESKAARAQAADLEQELAATFEPWEACPEVGAVSTAWQNTPADAAFHYDPAMLPYSVDVFCGGYQLTGPARGAVQDYSGLSFVTRDFWTDRRQAVSSELLRELREAFGLPSEP